MKIQNTNNTFKAKVPINTRTILKKTPLYKQYTPIDAMFNENAVVKSLDNFSVFVKNKILCRYFNNPKNFIEKSLVKLQQKAIFLSRMLADRIFLLHNYSQINKIDQGFNKIDRTSPEYIEEIAKIGGSIPDKYVIVNSEDKVLDDLAKTDDAAIFLLNHPNYHKDKFVYTIINSMLNQMYTANNKQAECPRPRILVSRNMLKIVHPKIARIYKQLGLTPVDASLNKKDSLFNIKSMKRLLIEFIKNQSNIFFFPEGNNSAYIDKPFEEKLQPGTAQFIRTALSAKNKAKIIPIGINYTNEKNSLGKIYISSPIVLERYKNTLICNGKEHSKYDDQSIQDLICSEMKSSIARAKNS